jgi:hypothetical protein
MFSSLKLSDSVADRDQAQKDPRLLLESLPCLKRESFSSR